MASIQVWIRSICRNPGLTLLSVVALALGVGANTALFTVINSLVLHPYQLSEANRVVAILEREPNDTSPRVAPADYFDLISESANFSALGAWRGSFSTLRDAGATDQIWTVAVSEHLFSLLGATSVLGRSLQIEDYKPSAARTALLSHREWLSRFAANPTVIGRTIWVDDHPYTIVGVMPKGFILPGYRRSDIFLPFRPDHDDRTDRNNRSLYVCGLLKPTVSLQQAASDLERVTQRLRRQWPHEVQGRELFAKSFRDYISEESRPALIALLGASAFVLLIAAANVDALLLAKTVVRRHEIALRRALGVRKWIVGSQVDFSLVLLVAAGLLLGSFLKLVKLEIGFDRNNVLLVNIDLGVARIPEDRQAATYEEIESRLSALPGVLSVGRSTITPISGIEGLDNSVHTGWTKPSIVHKDCAGWLEGDIKVLGLHHGLHLARLFANAANPFTREFHQCRYGVRIPWLLSIRLLRAGSFLA
jgi:hypothetical protein